MQYGKLNFTQTIDYIKTALQNRDQNQMDVSKTRLADRHLAENWGSRSMSNKHHLHNFIHNYFIEKIKIQNTKLNMSQGDDTGRGIIYILKKC